MPQIICPNCHHSFEATDALRDEIQKEVNLKAAQWRKEKEEEYKLKETGLHKQSQQLKENYEKQIEQHQQAQQAMLENERKKIAQQMEEYLRKQLEGDYENRLKILQQANAENEEKLKLARKGELEFLQEKQRLQEKENEIDIEIQRKVLESRGTMAEQIRREETEKNNLVLNEYQLQITEFKKQAEDNKKMLEEVRRKAEQGSMQLQGEAQELALEDLLKVSFPYDDIQEVGKGVRGADCIQIVRNKYGQECGSIIFESKRTQSFASEWIEKLKADMRNQKADVAVIVTRQMPKDMTQFGEKEGIWICSFSEVKGLAYVLREGIIKVSTALKSQANKGNKMEMLYEYLTSHEFGEQWKAIREGFLSIRHSIQKERDAMEKLWKVREKQVEKVLLNMLHFKGSIEGIAGQDFHMDLLDDATEDVEI